MDRERQIEVMTSADVRTQGYLRAWIKDPAVRAALHRDTRVDRKPAPQQTHARRVG